jgi:hypothetical protein
MAMEIQIPIDIKHSHQISNAVDHLELAISLYDEDGSGRLKRTKDEKPKRTFDEHNAWATYSQFVATLKWSTETEDGLAKSKVGLEKIKGTRDFAKSLVKQYDNYIAGRSVPWTRGGIPYIRMHCNEDDYLSVRDSNGLTYMEGSSCISIESSELPVPVRRLTLTSLSRPSRL